jgi:beta-ribofuranosylaminobenzene 5'-phosphate synthase
MPRSVIVSSPSRLHFGLFSIGSKVERMFGGMGLMIDSPRTIVKVGPASQLTVAGLEPVACRSAVERWFRYSQTGKSLPSNDVTSCDELPIRIDVDAVAPRHCGLGSGTQLALSVAMAVSKWLGTDIVGPNEIGQSVGRGNRSAIGTYGFFRGGLLIDRGKTQHERMAPLDLRIDFPEHWPILLVIDRVNQGLSGNDEFSAFDALPDVDEETRNQMVSLVRDRVVPAAMTADFEAFAESLYEFGHRSGMFFEEVQGGAYNGRPATEVVRFVRQMGLRAVGQSSWGPCIFVIGRHDEELERCRREIQLQFGDRFELTATRADNRGAIIQLASSNLNRDV